MISATYRISGGDFDGAGAATRTLKGELARIGVESGILRRIMIAAYEAEMNVVIHSSGGNMWARIDDHRLDLEIVDEGPGISDIDLAMKEGWSTAGEKARQMGFGAGMGLPNIRKSSDLFEIESRAGRGTRIRSTIYLTRMVPEPPRRSFLGINAVACRSCMDCVKACPAKALRVRGGGPRLLEHLCVGCTACISACPTSAFSAGEEPAPAALPVVPEGAALVVPLSFVRGFPGGMDPRRVMSALAALGFSRIRFTEEWEAALEREAGERASAAGARRPLIPPLCPAVVNLVETYFPSLIPHLVPLSSPVAAAAGEFSSRAVFLTAACPAQYAEAAQARLTDRLTILSPRTLAAALVPLLTGKAAGAGSAVESAAGAASAAESTSGAATLPRAEGASPRDEASRARRVTGIRHVMAVLEQYEGGALSGPWILELYACDQGCAGSPLHSSDPYVAALRREDAAVNSTGRGSGPEPMIPARKKPYAPRPGLRLDPDMGAAISKLSRIDALRRTLPGRDCGTCGAPSCAALAEDVVLGRAEEADCPFKEKRT